MAFVVMEDNIRFLNKDSKHFCIYYEASNVMGCRFRIIYIKYWNIDSEIVEVY